MRLATLVKYLFGWVEQGSTKELNYAVPSSWARAIEADAVRLATADNRRRHLTTAPQRAVCTGGQGASPYEQNTQQCPRLGRSTAPQPAQS